MKLRRLAGPVVLVVLVLVTAAGCSSDPQPPVTSTSFAQAVGEPFDVGPEDMTIHAFLADPQTKSGGFRMNCYPLWRDVETKKGHYDWELFDLAISNQRLWGATDLMYSFCGTPEWAATKPKDPSVEVFGPSSSAPPKSMQDYEDYVRAVVKRYKGQIGAYEVWNEASSPQFWQGTPKQMLKMTESLNRIVEEEDPSAVVSMASMQTHREDYYKGFVVPYLKKLQSADWPIDVYNGHFYPRGEGGPAQRRKQIEMFRNTLGELNAPEKPLWDTEVNYYVGLLGGEPDGRITGDRAAAWAVRTYLDGWRLNLPRNYWYFGTAEYNAFPGIQTTPGAPATRALATFHDWVVGSRFNGCQETEQLVNCSFVRDDKEFFIAWAEAGNDTDNPRVAFPLTGPAEICRLPDNTCSELTELTVDQVPVLVRPGD